MKTANELSVSSVQFTPASTRDVQKGLLGFVSLVIDGCLRLDGIALRSTLDGKRALSFPARRDRQGRDHPIMRPIDSPSRLAIEKQIFQQLDLLNEISQS